MNVMQSIIESVLSALGRQPEAYTTVVYPTRGKAVLVYDGLGLAAERSWYKIAEVSREEKTILCTPNGSSVNMSEDYNERSSIGDEMIPMGFVDHWYAGDCKAVNPATGLPHDRRTH